MQFFTKMAGWLAAAGLSLALSACDSQPVRKAPPPPQVSAVTVQARTVPITYEYPGRVAGYKETEVRARVGGILLKRNFDEGAAVKEGQVLFEIDPSLYEAEFAKQKALLAQTKAAYSQSVLDADRAQALWLKQYQSTAYRDQTAAKRDANAASVEQAEASLRQAELNLSYTKVTAPISGVTSLEHVPEGSLIATDPSSNLMTTITQTDPAYVNFSYAGSDAQAMRDIMADMRAHNEPVEALKVKIRFGDGRDYGALGTMDFTSPTIDQSTGALGVRAIVPNPDNILVPGQFVRLIVQGLERNNAIAIPEQALMQDSAGQYVYVVTPQDEIEKRAVETEMQLSDRDWLLAKGREAAASDEAEFVEPGQKAAAQKVFTGLRDGERVITEGQFRISSALGALPPGVKLKVAVMALDGKPTAAAQAMQAQAAQPKK